jgi:IS5 family transposase
MIGNIERPGSLFYFVLGNQVSLIKDDLLEPVDSLLGDEALLEIVTEALGRRRPRSGEVGREGMAPDRLLRSFVLKHLKQWSFRELAREVRNSLLYRKFTRFDADVVPDASTFCRNFELLDGDAAQKIHKRIVVLSKDAGVAQGRRMRSDTTVVETDIRHPTDSGLLADGIRVLTRLLRRAGACLPGITVVGHARSTMNRVLEIRRAARCMTEANRRRLERSYRRLLAIARGVLRQSMAVAARMGRTPTSRRTRELDRVRVQLEHYSALLGRVIGQTKARLFGGDTHAPHKVLSLFEPHTEVIRKGKAGKPTEFGRLLRIDEVENGIVSNFAVLKGNPSDTSAWIPALDGHVEVFGRPPEIAVADRGYHSAANEGHARKLGVKTIALPARGPLSATQKAKQRGRAFRRAQRWRAGIEARNSALKHRYGLDRARYRGEAGFLRYVAGGIIVNNLVAIARTLVRRRMRRVA